MILGYTTHSRRELAPSSSPPRKKSDGEFLCLELIETVKQSFFFPINSKGAKRRKHDPRS